MGFHTEISLFSNSGERKYLNRDERRRFYRCAKILPLEKQLFVLLMYFTGARISEIQSLKIQQLDFDHKSVIIRTLKKRKSNVYRNVPLPDHLLKRLKNLIANRNKSQANHPREEELWWFSIRTARRCIKSVMIEADITGPRACGRGLRHSYAVLAASKVPITQLQKWLGHSDVATTSIYLDVSGVEEREWASRLWDEEE